MDPGHLRHSARCHYRRPDYHGAYRGPRDRWECLHRHRPRPAPPPPPEPPETEPEDPRGKHAKDKGTQRPVLAEITADGFVPGEDVAIAVIVSHTDATGTGSTRTLLDTSQLASLLRTGTGEVVLFGRVSGTTHVRRLP